MKQTKWKSLTEQLFNIGSGLIISALIVQPIIFPLYGIVIDVFHNIVLASIFTIASIVRGYLWRRWFNIKVHINGQPKLESLIEQLLNVLSGLILSTFVIQPLAFPLFDISTTHSENFQMAVIFTIVSIIRSYYWRRWFNHKLHFKKEN